MLPKIEEPNPEELTPLQAAMYAVAEAMEYPVDNQGRVYDLRYLIPIICYHLPRAGIGPVEGLAVIKKRAIPPSAQVMEGAVEWVPISAADSIAEEIDGATTLADLEQMSPAARAIAIRRIGGNDATVSAVAAQDTDLDQRTPWRGVETRIHFED